MSVILRSFPPVFCTTRVRVRDSPAGMLEPKLRDVFPRLIAGGGTVSNCRMLAAAAAVFPLMWRRIPSLSATSSVWVPRVLLILPACRRRGNVIEVVD